MKSIAGILIAVALLAALAACNDVADPAAPQPFEFTGTAWRQTGWDVDAAAVVYEPVARLAGEIVGFAFGADGTLTYRSFGFCATPPLIYFDMNGTWHRPADTVLEIVLGGEDLPVSGIYEIVSLNAGRLVLRRRAAENSQPAANGTR